MVKISEKASVPKKVVKKTTVKENNKKVVSEPKNVIEKNPKKTASKKTKPVSASKISSGKTTTKKSPAMVSVKTVSAKQNKVTIDKLTAALASKPKTKKPVKKSESETEKLFSLIIKGIQEKKGIDIIDLNLKNVKNSVADHFIICEGTSNTQVFAIADSIEFEVKKGMGIRPWHKEGFENAEWILIDYFDIVVHIFIDQSRTFYQLENLWADAEITKIAEPKNVKK